MMIDILKAAKAANKTGATSAHAGPETETFSDITDAMHWCFLRRGYIKGTNRSWPVRDCLLVPTLRHR
jgi:hypothetical protein